MRTVFDTLTANWSLILIPLAVFGVSLIALFWLRKQFLDYLALKIKKQVWLEEISFISSIKSPLSILSLIISVYLGLTVSSVSGSWKHYIGTGLWTLFIIALAITSIGICRNLISFWGKKHKFPAHLIQALRDIARIVLLAIAVLIILELWDVPVTVLLLVVAVILLLAFLVFRDAVPDLLASFQIAAAQEIKAGDYIKIEGREEGYVTEISWNKTRLKGLDGSIVLIPNNTLIHYKIVNYGYPLKKSLEPFRFNTHVHMAELTGLRAKNLDEFLEIFKNMPESVIYYHTHHALEENQYFHPELSNDFSNWIKYSLDNDVLGEKLANLSPYEFSNLTGFRDKAVDIINEYIANQNSQRTAPEGREFHFMKSVSIVLPTVYQAYDLREFVEALRKISHGSLYFHMFESRLRLGNQQNDFSIWLKNSLGEEDLSREVAEFDPQNYNLEGLRSLLIQKIEKHIK